MKKLLTWAGVGLLTTALLDPLLHSMLDKPVPWFRDLIMLALGAGCFWLLVRFRNEM